VSRRGRKYLRIIVNGKYADDPALRQALAWARREGHRVEWRVTREPGDGAPFAADRRRGPVDVMVAAGGDGTINEVLNGMLANEVTPPAALAIVPLGTANDFAKSCGIPLDDPIEALRLAWEGEPRLIDVGRANERFFINVATGGFAAEVAAKTPEVAKKILGGAAYAATGVVAALDIKSYPGTLSLPEEPWQGNLVVITIGNGRQAGGFPVAPKAALDDGLLDIMVIHDAGLPQAGQVLSELRKVDAAENRYIFYRQVPWCRLELTQEIRLDVDGEPILGRVFDFRALPRRLKILLPPQTSLSWQ
jgi:lipid kinase YegS